jgi:hypothetical protein
MVLLNSSVNFIQRYSHFAYMWWWGLRLLVFIIVHLMDTEVALVPFGQWPCFFMLIHRITSIESELLHPFWPVSIPEFLRAELMFLAHCHLSLWCLLKPLIMMNTFWGYASDHSDADACWMHFSQYFVSESHKVLTTHSCFVGFGSARTYITLTFNGQLLSFLCNVMDYFYWGFNGCTASKKQSPVVCLKDMFRKHEAPATTIYVGLSMP